MKLGVENSMNLKTPKTIHLICDSPFPQPCGHTQSGVANKACEIGSNVGLGAEIDKTTRECE